MTDRNGGTTSGEKRDWYLYPKNTNYRSLAEGLMFSETNVIIRRDKINYFFKS